MIDLETAEFLLSPEGDKLLEEAKSLEGTFLARVSLLRRHYPPRFASAALELLELRRRGAKKFSRADRMFFTREALEQASGEVISSYRASRFPKEAEVLDLACGIGGDTIALAARCFVTGVDRDSVRILMARRNVEVYDLSQRARFVCADVTTIPLKADAAFLDPSRRVDKRRVVRLSELSPPLDFIRRLAGEIPDCAVKLSPAAPDSELDALGAEIEFISESGECKEALAWFGAFKTASRRATVLPGGLTLVRQDVAAIPVRTPGRYLYEPDPCVIRAHLVEQLAVKIGAWKIDEQIAYLSSDDLAQTGFAEAYAIIETAPFNLKALKGRLREMGVGSVIVKKRGVPFEPREIERRLKGTGAREVILVLTRIADKPSVLICERASAGSASLSGE